MRKAGFAALFCSLVFCASTLTAGTITVEASASYSLALLTGSGSWSFSYLSGAPGLLLQSVTIDLAPTAGLAFDTAPGGFGSLGYQDVGNFNGTDVTTGLTGYTPAGSALDGGTLLTFNFSDFAAGETFQFNADVDHPNPTLTNCAGKSGLALAACNLANTAALTAAQTVTANQMANATVTFTFGGADYIAGSSTGTFGNVTLREILQNGPGNQLGVSAAVDAPEPATLGLIGGALILASILLRRKTVTLPRQP
jgi:hypothetical protein